MAKQVADVQIHASDSQDPLEDDNLDVSVDLIDERLYLGNLACARDYKTLEKLQVTHVLTIDVVPLPRSILDRANLTFKYIKLADVPKEDLISHLPETNEFIKEAIGDDGTVLVHCYFGVSRSAAVVVAYIMEKYRLCYEEAFDLVKSKRRFIHPNMGFQAQLKLFGHMGYRLNKDDPRFKQFRLKMAGQKLKQVKILPQQFADLVKPDPGLVRERPDPVVYRCKTCRRIVAGHTNLIPHLPKEVLDGYSETNLVDGHITVRDCPSACTLMWFVEPMAWMRGVQHELHGKLHCPKCQNKIGSFNWVMGCKCPCGQKVAPAFYLVPSKVEWSNIVQNVQVTV
ncbi:dual specificity protein phosphatase MPK-4-like isoform X2 [Plodia interpunctella]|uniref:dual specificity protein phosphatase MPK-4-like isoform X2 n=1 Tax=Plodia interpunctella TaxID=58824 RepID=UPI0023679191|nr:dual specificity protein phosphatase MPK-4-like isoform X2 [Plodia interpunctella]